MFKTIFLILLFASTSSVATARTWQYRSQDQRHVGLKIHDWDGQYRITGSLYYTDGIGIHEAFYKWSGLIERLPSGRFSENGKIVVKRAIAKFTSGSDVCMVPIEVILYLPKGKDYINGFYVESKLPWDNIHAIKGDPSKRCQEPQYFWARDPNPYWIENSWQ